MKVSKLMECLGIDVTGPHPPSNRGKRYILTVIDHFSRWTEAFPMRNQEALTVAKILVEQWITSWLLTPNIDGSRSLLQSKTVPGTLSSTPD